MSPLRTFILLALVIPGSGAFAQSPAKPPVDLAQFKVKLKAEFQGSNADVYRPDAIVATSVGRDSVEPTNKSTAPRRVALPEALK